MTAPRLLAITPPSGLIDAAVVQVWRDAGALGAGLAVLLREPGRSPRALVEAGGRLSPLSRACSRLEVPVLLSCDPDRLSEAAEVVRAHGLAGVQLRGDPSVQSLDRARTLLPDAIVGRSCHGLPGQTAPPPVDYTCFAPVFAPRTATPGRVKAPAGLELLRRWTADPQAWIVALGGIDPSRAKACVEAGARGLAGISLFFGAHEQLAQDVTALVRTLRTA